MSPRTFWTLAALPLAMAASYAAAAESPEPESMPVIVVKDPGEPDGPEYIRFDGHRMRLPVILKSGFGVAAGISTRTPHQSLLNTAAPGFQVDSENALAITADARWRFARYAYAQARATHESGELTYQSGAQRERFDFTNTAGELRAGGIIDLGLISALDGYVGYGAYHFDSDVADIQDGGVTYGVNLTRLLRWRIEASIGYAGLHTGSKAIDDDSEDQGVLRLAFPLGRSVRFTTAYATGTERVTAGFAIAW